MSYAQLAAEAGCTVRSVRNYLERAPDIFGFDIERVRNGHREVLVRAVGLTARSHPADEPLAALGSAFVQALFGRGGPPASSSPLLVAVRGAYPYTERHRQAFGLWMQLCQKRPRQAARMRTVAHAANDSIVWPLGSVLHNVEGLLLAFLPLEATGPEHIQIMDLGMLADAPDALQPAEPAESGDPAIDLDGLDLQSLLDLPFHASRTRAQARAMVKVAVRFRPEHANTEARRLWHSSQRALLRRDGSLDLRFGPVDLDAAASWASSMGDALEVLGSKKLRKAVKKKSFSPG